MAGKTNGRAPRALSQSTVARTMTSILAIPRLPAPTATVSPRLMARWAAARVSRTPPGISSRRVRGKVCRTLNMVGSLTGSRGDMAGSYAGLPDLSMNPSTSLTFKTSTLTTGGQSMADLWPMRLKFLWVSATLASLLLLQSGCTTITDWFRQRPQALPPASELYAEGETQLGKSRYEDARVAFRKVVERHPQSGYAPRARFLIGEAFYREGQYDKAIKEFEAFMSFYPLHEISDLAQFRLAMSYYDQMKPVEQDQEITRKAMEAFKVLVREYPESRYAADALAKTDICRGRLAQKELWVAAYYINQGNPAAARQRLEKVIKEFPRTLVTPEALFRLGEVYQVDGR